MQTFLPYESFSESAKCLDWRRLGKQRVEGKQILNALNRGEGGWFNHPATQMWKGFEEALKSYTNEVIQEWETRGYNNNMKLYEVGEESLVMPWWIGVKEFHLSHQSKLVQKNPEHYEPLFPNVPRDLDYYWPTKESHDIR